MRLIDIQPRAEHDLFEQWSYINTDNPEAADRFTLSARDTLRMLAELPNIGSVYTSSASELSALRKVPIRGFEQHLIFYTLGKNDVKIIRVLHAKRDIENLL